MREANFQDIEKNPDQVISILKNGEHLVVLRDGKQFYEFRPIKQTSVNKQMGTLKGKIWIAPNFDDVDEEIEYLFYGEEIE